ncbi:MAG TPA: GyrI-like domain-containing protein [Vicinamibacterales bacterium]
MSDYNVRLESLDSIPVAVIRRNVRHADLPRVVPEGCGIVWNALRAQGVRGGRHVAIYWDGGIRLEVGTEVMVPFSEQGDVVRSGTPAGLAAWTTHFGPYNELGAAHAAVGEWCKKNGHATSGPNWEIYGHWQQEWNSNPSQIRTDVFYLVRS